MIIVRYAEIGLKGKNRSFFEKTLIKNIRACLDAHKIEYGAITRPYGRIMISTNDSCDCLKCVFGIASFSNAVNVGFNMNEIKKASLEFVKGLSPEKSFRVTCQRLDKTFPLTSQQFEIELGAFIKEHTCAKVKMKGFDVDIQAEIIQGFVYLFSEKTKGLGGLPMGIEGKVLVLIEDDSSLLAGLQMMKRGCSIIPVALKEIKIDLLQKYCFVEKLELRIIKDLSEIDALARETRAKAIAVNDTLDTMRDFNFETKVLRPLIAYENKEIEEELNAFRQKIC
ncbi:MAG: THUMP domain-containing protein [Candidatus Woesearchaeota archaeon]